MITGDDGLETCKTAFSLYENKTLEKLVRVTCAESRTRNENKSALVLGTQAVKCKQLNKQ